MVQKRPIVLGKSDAYEEPVLDIARRKIAREGGSLKKALQELRQERRERALAISLAEAPSAVKQADGTYKRVSSDPRWPFGVEGDLMIAPFGLSECGLPRTRQPSLSTNKSALAARGEARDIIMDKLNRLGCDPIKIIAEIAMDVDEENAVRLRAASELATMIYPRLRGVESTQREDTKIFVIGVPQERPETVDAWLTGAEGPRRIAQAIAEAETPAIDGEIISVTGT